MAAGEEFTRARCRATGAIAALPKEAIELGHIPGWEAVDGPLPEGPKPAAFPEQYEEPAALDEVGPEDNEFADSESADEEEE